MQYEKVKIAGIMVVCFFIMGCHFSGQEDRIGPREQLTLYTETQIGNG